MTRRLLLVTGAPRTATTPVGNVLAACRGTVSIYEPLGPTGLRRVSQPYPMVGAGLGLETAHLAPMLADLAALRPRGLKPQRREGRPDTLFTRVFGSRTMHSFRLATLRPWAQTVIWKDPHAVMLVPDLIDAGVDVVVTARTPRAHASSYKRLGWVSKAVEIYPRWSAKYGPCETVEAYLPRGAEPVVSGALLWRMSYLPLIRTGALRRARLVTSEALEVDERGTYERLIRDLGLVAGTGVEKLLSQNKREAKAADLSQQTHDWTRSVASVNAYWRDILGADDVEDVDRITADLVPRLFGERTA